MVEPLKHFERRCIICAIGCVLASAGMPWALAENLPDPTRPPAALYAAPGSLSSAPQSGPVLQSVFISAAKKTAIINGQELKVGDKLGEARVARIAESEVVLQEGKSTQTLRLFPGMERQSSFNRAANSLDLRRQ